MAEISGRACDLASAPPTYDEGNVYSMVRVRAVLVALAGMTLQWAALHSITFTGTVMGVPASVAQSLWSANSLCTFAVFLALFIMAYRRRLPSLLSRRAIACITVCLAAGMALLIAGSFAGAMACLYAGSVCIALGTTPLIVAWGEMYRYLNPKGEQLFVTLGAAIAAVAVYLIEAQLPAFLSVAVFAILPFLSVACLAKSHELLQASSEVWRSKTAAMGKSPALLLVCIAVFSIPYNYLRGGGEVQAVLSDDTAWDAVLSVALCIMAISAAVETKAESRGLLALPSIVLFLLTAAMTVHLMSGFESSLVVPSVLYAGYYLFLAMVYLALGPIVATSDANAVQLFAGAMLANVGGLLLGMLFGALDSLAGEMAATAMVMVCTYLMLSIGFILFYGHSYSIFRINSYDEDEYSFEFLSPIFDAPDAGCEGIAAVAAEEGSGEFAAAIKGAVDAAALAGGLSARESEVLVMLVRGRTIASIADEMVLSENTIKAHTKGIYRKLGVHTREELLARVEDMAG